MKDSIEVKFIEVRDDGTTMPCMVTAICVNATMTEAENWLVRRGGWGEGQVGLYFATLCPDANAYAIGLPGHPYIHTWSRGQNSRTLTVAWEWVQVHWDEVKSGDLIDVEFLLGERKTPKLSDRLHGTPEWEAAYGD